MKIISLLSLVAIVSCGSMKPTHQNIVVETKGEMQDDLYNRLPASECDRSKYVECKQARPNDYAKQYMIDKKGNLFRLINGVECAVTSNVESFKISQHPDDRAVVYYKKDGDLYAIGMDKERRPQGQCPSVKGNTAKLMEKVAHYTVTSNTNTTIVNSALSREGLFVAWDNARPVFTMQNISDFSMNSCYGQQGKSFNTYVLFARDIWGGITKVRVETNGYFPDNSSTRANGYASIIEFKDVENVCQSQEKRRR